MHLKSMLKSHVLAVYLSYQHIDMQVMMTFAFGQYCRCLDISSHELDSLFFLKCS